jgi:hypothetical protein
VVNRLRIADCGMRIGFGATQLVIEEGFKIRNPKSAIRN